MPYSIVLTNSTPLVTVQDGTVEQTRTNLTLIGREYPGYGTFLNTNFVHLLENFSSGTQPNKPLVGQLWWDSTNALLKVCTQNTPSIIFKIPTGSTTAPSSAPPSNPYSGDLWYDSTNQQIKVYSGGSGGSWILVGPLSATASTALPANFTGAAPVTMTASPSGTVYQVIQFLISGTIYAIFSKDSFSTVTPGFATIIPGLNFSTAVTLGLNTQSTAATASTLVQRDGSAGITVAAINSAGIAASGAVSAPSFTATGGGAFTGNVIGNVDIGTTQIRSGQVNASTIGSVSTSLFGTIQTAAQPNITSVGIINNLQTSGRTQLIGVAGTSAICVYDRGDGSGPLEVAQVGGSASFTSINNTPIGNNTPSTGGFTTVRITGNIYPAANGTIASGFAAGGFWGSMFVNTVFTSALTASAADTITLTGSLIPTANVGAANQSNLGSATRWFNNIFGRSIQAQYADLAERFHADAEYAPGTVVELGGTAEITAVVEPLSEKVFGVVSTNAAYLMNSGAGDNITHPPIAMSGRVPVRVIGLVTKGDRLVSAGAGRARSAHASELTPFNVIGRSLVDKTDEDETLIEAIVKINS
jgi:hypothetical protein